MSERSGSLALICCLLILTSAAAAPSPQAVTSTPIEAAIDALRSRFPNQIVVGFEELWDVRPDIEPTTDLGPANLTLQQVLERIRHQNPTYKVDLLPGGLVHVYPAFATADPPGLLDLRLREFFLPPDECVAQQFLYMDSPMHHFSYTPELSKYLWEHKMAWYRANGKGKEVVGIVGDFMGDCEPSQHRREPIYNNITVRQALNLIAVRSLEVASGRSPSSDPAGFKPKPISWKYRFRREPNADTGLDGVPVFQTF
jgi:hypothetical protein